MCVQPEQPRAGDAELLEQRGVLRDRHAQVARLQFLREACREGRVRQRAVNVGQEILGRDLEVVRLAE